MRKKNSPLLAEEAPALGAGGSQQVMEMMLDDQSPLERLIAQSTSEQAAAHSSPLFLLDEPPRLTYSSHSFTITSGTQRQPWNTFNNNTTTNSSVSLGNNIASSMVTLIAGTLCLFHMGLVWASFLSEAWFDTHLLVLMDLQRQYFPFLSTSSKNDGVVDQVLQTTSLASLLQTFLGAQQHWAAMTLVITSLILPCLCMMLCPAWTIGDHQNNHQMITPKTAPRHAAEYLIRLSFLAFFILVILDVGTSSLNIVGNGTKFRIVNETKAGLVCYTLGMCCAVGVILILRLARRSGNAEALESSPWNNPRRRLPSLDNRPRAPPNQAFQLPWRFSISTSDAQREQQRPLLDPAEMDDDAIADHGVVESLQIEPSDETIQSLSLCKKIKLYEFGTLSVVLWLPALLLPLFQVKFDGLISSFLEEVSFTVKFWELPSVLWQRGVDAQTASWIMIAIGTVFLFSLYVLPICSTILAVAVWRSSGNASLFYQGALRLIHPCLCGVVFAFSLLIALPAFEPIGEYLLNEETSGICKKFELITDESCLTIRGQRSIGLWFLLSQSLVLEVFILMTLAWKR